MLPEMPASYRAQVLPRLSDIPLITYIQYAVSRNRVIDSFF